MVFKWLFSDPSTIINARFWLLDDNESDGAGAGSVGGDGSDSGSTQVTQPESDVDGSGGSPDGSGLPQTRGQVGQPGRRPNQQQYVPYGRFQDVNRSLQTYRTYGKPEEIEAKLRRLEYLEKNPQNRYTPEQQQEIRDDIYRMIPELQQLRQTHMTQKTNYVSYGSRQNPEFCKQLGWESNDITNQLIEDTLTGVISRDPELRQRFFAFDPTVFSDAFKLVRPYLGAKTRNVPGLSLVNGKRPNPAGNAPKKPAAEGKPTESKATPGSPLYMREVLSEASDRAFDMISQQEE